MSGAPGRDVTRFVDEADPMRSLVSAAEWFSKDGRYALSVMQWEPLAKHPTILKAIKRKSQVKLLCQIAKARPHADVLLYKEIAKLFVVLSEDDFSGGLSPFDVLEWYLEGMTRIPLNKHSGERSPEPAHSAAWNERHNFVQGDDSDRFAGKDEANPSRVVLRLLQFLLRQLSFEFLTDSEKASMEIDRDDLPDTVVDSIVNVIARCWKVMRVDTMGGCTDCEKTMTIIDDVLEVWERHADQNPITFVKDTAGQAVMEIRLVVCRLLELQPILLTSAPYARVRPKLIRLDDKVAIQALNFARHKALSLRSSCLVALAHDDDSLSMPSMPWMRQLIPPGKEDLLVVRVRSGMAPVTPRTMMRTQKDRKKTAALLTAASNGAFVGVVRSPVATTDLARDQTPSSPAAGGSAAPSVLE
ncbi:hypothetical protein PPROV_000984800 [Pycnococcus provasolii]|uniref:Uncharacterized protein n=1 Tax=Pycnococcus provasolii TaxID=41880 RepID=A0A830HVZ1_9CHLO|nr:hypothetical protein PPROV_000984800 [Pycnococcus provasolii]